MEQAKDFDCIKTALLSAFHIDAESCETKFENTKLFQHEAIAQFYVRLTGLWKEWEYSSEIEKTSESLRDDILKARLSSRMSPNLIIHLKI